LGSILTYALRGKQGNPSGGVCVIFLQIFKRCLATLPQELLHDKLDAEIFTVDFPGHRKPHSGITQGVYCHPAEICIKNNIFTYTFQGKRSVQTIVFVIDFFQSVAIENK